MLQQQMKRDMKFLDDYPVIRAWFGVASVEDFSLPFLVYPEDFPSIDTRVQSYAKAISIALRESQAVKKKREARV